MKGEVDHMLACLRDREDKLCSDAADVIERMRRERQEVDRRIHNQRRALRQNWEIVEMRAQYKRAWYPSKLLTQLLKRGAEWKASRDGQSEAKE